MKEREREKERGDREKRQSAGMQQPVRAGVRERGEDFEKPTRLRFFARALE